MTILQIFGLILIAIPFVVITAVIIKQLGWLEALAIWLVVCITVLLFVIGAQLVVNTEQKKVVDGIQNR